ncbi:myb-like protein X, partial [Exaiptasia diaphana]|uniref:Lens epithelium-derived growth factor integrase-binding domain-containing protein n=1 Tax=Exaiptasia diaphana TaxID=2652724 RepID=A0A913YUN5_EXADI
SKKTPGEKPDISKRKDSTSDENKKKLDSEAVSEENEEEQKRKKEEAERRRQEKLEKRKKEKELEKQREKERLEREKQREKEKLEREKQKEKERQEKERQKEKEKIEWQKHRERLRNPSIFDTLELYDQDLKLSLTVEAPDITRCINTLGKISDMPITPEVMKKSPAIIQTIKKIRNYKLSSKVRERATELYNKLKSLFLVTGTDTPITATPATPTTATTLTTAHDTPVRPALSMPTPLTTTQLPFTPVEVKPKLKPLPKLDMPSPNKIVNQAAVKTERDIRPQSTEEQSNKELTFDKENSTLDQKTQNGENRTDSTQDKNLDFPMQDDQADILTPCDMEISSPI